MTYFPLKNDFLNIFIWKLNQSISDKMSYKGKDPIISNTYCFFSELKSVQRGMTSFYSTRRKKNQHPWNRYQLYRLRQLVHWTTHTDRLFFIKLYQFGQECNIFSCQSSKTQLEDALLRRLSNWWNVRLWYLPQLVNVDQFVW